MESPTTLQDASLREIFTELIQRQALEYANHTGGNPAHYEPELQGSDKKCSTCGKPLTYERGDVRWCDARGALHVATPRSVATSSCFPCASGVALAMLPILMREDEIQGRGSSEPGSE